ncbi:glycoside hydrolase family 5 protein [Fibrobacter sp.]|uniref:glycoside hydrolase family 5 protein n=1 Tax=Fibrobacter sp. TaxID=35828 RepID=UPI00389119EE
MKISTYSIICSALLMGTSAFAALPKSTTLVEPMGMGYNIGNTMEVPEEPTNWGNPLPTKEYIKAIKAAGFNTVRIPCAWYSHSDALTQDVATYGSKDDKTYKHVGAATSFTTPTIKEEWLKQVKDVVDMIIAEGMYVVLNSHWDEGWLEDRVYNGTANPRSGAGDIANSSATTEARQKAFWSQIATFFKDYDEHLLFAGANEPGVNDPWNGTQWEFDNARMKILQGYYNAFINAVRSAGGNNDTRTLIVQAPRTEMDFASMLNSNMPTDPAGAGYMMVEVHYYPYQYSLMTADEDWGKQFYYYTGLESTTDKEHNMGWNVYSNSIDNTALGTPNQIKKAFGELKIMFCDKGIPVIIGELGAIKRTNQLSGDNLKLHLQGRALFYGEVAKNAKANGIIPYVWDTGAENDGNMTFITRQKGVYNVLDPDCLNAMRAAYGQESQGSSNLDSLVNENTVPETADGKAVLLTYKTVTSDSSEVGTLRVNLSGNFKDLSKYTGITVRIKGSVASAGPAANSDSEYGWTALEVFMMTGGSWDWFDATVAAQADLELTDQYKDITVNFSDFRKEITGLNEANAIGFNLYGTQVTGTIMMDYILLNKADGSADTLTNFDTKPDAEGIASAKIVAANSSLDGTSALQPRAIAKASGLRVIAMQGKVSAMFSAARAGKATAMLMNGLGQVIAKQSFDASAGVNTVELTSGFRGTAFLVIRQGSQNFTAKVNMR